MDNPYKTYWSQVEQWPVERNDLARDLFIQFIDNSEYEDPSDLASRAFDAADAFMSELKRREEHEQTNTP